jgi:uncharacterized membrane protein
VDRLEGKQLHNKIYEEALRAKRSLTKANVQIAVNEKTVKANDEALRILKVRLAKGEITAQEYEEKKRLIEQ